MIQVSEKCYYINCPAKIGIYVANKDTVYLIDSGNDKDAGRKARQILDKNGWHLTAILNTHSNADHIGGNHYLQGQTECKVYSAGIEAAFTKHPVLEPSFLYGGYPCKDLRHKFLLAQESNVTDFSDESFPKEMVELCTKGNLQGIHFVGRDNCTADKNAPIQWSHTFSGNINYLPTCVTEAKYIINLANLKGHSYGITLCGKNHFGSFINRNAMYPPEGANLHQWLTKNDMAIYSPLVDLMGNWQIGKKTVLYLLDALICAPSEGRSVTKENSTWQQPPFNGNYTSSIFVSQDPVAIDSVGADFLANEPTLQKQNATLRNNPNVENYLHEAGLIKNAPSGIVYYDGNGKRLTNLGVHEHWNNSAQKQYSRNLGREEGIELIRLSPTKK